MNILTMKSGQTVTFQEHGNPGDEPIFFFHGTPGSRTQLDFLPTALRENLHWIAIDRPGYSESSRCQDLGMDDVTAMVTARADHLHIERFQVLGFSGGVPMLWLVRIACRTVFTHLTLSAALDPLIFRRYGLHYEVRTIYYLRSRVVLIQCFVYCYV